MTDPRDRKMTRDQVDSLARLEIKAQGVKPFMIEWVVAKVVRAYDVASKHDARVMVLLEEFVRTRVQVILRTEKNDVGVRVYGHYPTGEGNRWQLRRNMTAARFLLECSKFHSGTVARNVVDRQLLLIEEEVKAQGIASDQAITEVWDDVMARMRRDKAA